MKIKEWPEIFKSSLHILEKIQEAGYEAYFVGGSVRDYLLNLPIHDVDIATSAYPDEIKKIFSRTIDTGIEHGTVTVMEKSTPYEITTFRTETGYQDYRRPDEVTFVRSLKDDLKRRDFTINALAISPTGEIIDEFNGLDDLKNKTLKAVGKAHDRFNEDALRMMRAVRFSSQLNFDIEINTKKAIVENANLLLKISIERINTEFVKMMLSDNWKKGLEFYIDSNLYKYCPFFDDKKDNLKKLLLLKDIKINNTRTAWSLITQLLQITNTNSFLSKWKESNQVKNDVSKINLLTSVIASKKYDPWNFYLVGDDFIDDVENICELRNIKFENEKILKIYKSLPIRDKHELAIDGRVLIEKLNITPGPKLGKVLRDIEKKVVHNEIKNDSNELLDYCKKVI
ncbi:CCA tRNA nucleotidyltransferase [Companilactobacillus sp. DQM5]|uniref:CCA tRNA nucleotidyltransferase n=1 Tax=Companilactobacillus sp. DQM5 TaxID=3463359 RepID=UPI004059FE81